MKGIVHDSLRTALCWVITQKVMVISYRRFGATHRGPFFKRQEGKKEFWILYP